MPIAAGIATSRVLQKVRFGQVWMMFDLAIHRVIESLSSCLYGMNW